MNKNKLKRAIFAPLLLIIIITLQGCNSDSILKYLSCTQKGDVLIEKDEKEYYDRTTNLEVKGQVVAGSVVKNATVNIYTWNNASQTRLPFSYGSGQTGEDGSFQIIIDKHINIDNELLVFVSTGGSFYDKISKEIVNIPKEIELHSLVYPSELGENIAINTRTRFVKKIVEAKKVKFPRNKKNPWRFGYYSESTEGEWKIVDQHKRSQNDIKEGFVDLRCTNFSEDKIHSYSIDTDNSFLSFYRTFYEDNKINMLNFYKKMDAYILTLSKPDCSFENFNLIDSKKSNLFEEHSMIWSSIALMTYLEYSG